jgi:hypothetical protein
MVFPTIHHWPCFLWLACWVCCLVNSQATAFPLAARMLYWSIYLSRHAASTDVAHGQMAFPPALQRLRRSFRISCIENNT